MDAEDYGLNYGLKPGQRTPSVAALRRRQKREQQVVKVANKTLARLSRNPDLAAQTSLLSVSSALHPDNPYYADTLKKLNKVVSANPGTQPDAAAATIYANLDPTSKLGTQVSNLQSMQTLNDNAQELQLQYLKRQGAEADRQAQATAEALGPFGYVKAFSQVTFNALDFLHQVETNVFRQVVNTDDDQSNPLLSLATAGLKGETYANTDLGFNIMGGLDYATTGRLNDSFLDMGDGYLPSPESPVTKLRKSWDQQMMGTAGRNMRTIEIEQPDGTVKKEIVDDSPASPGQWVAADVFDMEVGSRPYQFMSGVMDAGSYLLDPSMYLTARGITKGFVAAENKLLRAPFGRELHPTALDQSAAMEIGSAVRSGEEARARMAAADERVAANQAKLDQLAQEKVEAEAALRGLDEAIADARSPQSAAASAADEAQAARDTLLPHGREVAETGQEGSRARQAHMVAGEVEDQVRAAVDVVDSHVQTELRRRFTPVEEAAPVADDAAPVADDAVEVAPAAPTPGSVHAVLREDGKFDIIHRSTGGKVAEAASLDEAEGLAANLSRMPGYADDVPLEDLHSWEWVTSELNKTPAVEASDAGTAAAPRSLTKLIERRKNLEDNLTQLAQTREELLSYADSLEIHRDRAEKFARLQAGLLSEQMTKSRLVNGEHAPKSDDLGDVLEYLRDPAGLHSGVNGVNVDRALGFITNNYNGGWTSLLDSFAAIKDEAILYDVTRGKLGAEAIRDLAKAKDQNEVRAALAKHMARPDSLSENMGRLRGVKVAAQVRFGADLDSVVSRYGQWFGEAGLSTVVWGKQIKRSAVPWAHARHIDDEDGVVDLAYDQITYALNMNRPASRKGGEGFAGKGGVGRRSTEGTEPLLDAKGNPVIDEAGQPVMKSDFEDVAYESAREFRSRWVKEFVNAESGQQRRALWNKMHSELVDRAADIQGLPHEVRTQFKKALRLSKLDADNLTKYNVGARAEVRGNQLLFDGKVVSDDFAALEAQMSEFLIAPDWVEMRRGLSAAKEVLDTGGVYGASRKMLEEITGTVFERYWRTSVIAFRGAYLIRNMADIQMRMMLAGHPSMLTSPGGVMALAFSHVAAPETRIGKALEGFNQRVGKALDGLKRGDTDLMGRSFYDELEPEVADYLRPYLGPHADMLGATAFQDLAAKPYSHADPGMGAAPRRELIAYEEVRAPDPGTSLQSASRFIDGWEFNLGLLKASPMARMAFDVSHGEVPAFLRRFAGPEQGRPQEALVSWLISDKEGRKILDQARDGSGQIRAMTGDPDFDGGRVLYEYLFGDSPASVMSAWNRLTLNGDPALVAAVKRPRPEKEEAYWQQREATRRVIKSRLSAPENGYVVDGLFTDKPLPVQAVSADIVKKHKNGFWARYDKLVDMFFSASGKFEHAAGYLPEFRYHKWDRAAQLAHVLSPDDAAALVASAEKALGSKVQMPNSWAAKTLRQLKRNAKNAKGSGAFTLDDLEHATDVMAARQVKELFYDARNRNQFANSLRLLSPFAQPWANTLMQWTKLGLANPGRVYAAGLVFSAAEGRNSNWLTDDPMSPNDAFFYRDPVSRQLTVGIPLMGPAMGLLANLNPVEAARNVTSPNDVWVNPSMIGGGIQLQSMNIALQDGLLPGAGPVVTLSARVLEQFGWYRSSMPDVVKDAMIGYVGSDPDADPTVASTLLPAWAQGLLGSLGFRDWAPKMEKYMPAAFQALAQVNPDSRYFSVDADGVRTQSDAQRAAFYQDAEHYAASMLFGRSLIQNVAPGAPQVQQLMVADDGRIMATAKLAQEYRNLYQESGDRGQALASILDRYGPDALFSMLPTRGSMVTPTNDAYKFLKANPGKSEEYGAELIKLLSPDGGYSARMDRYSRLAGEDPKLPWTETAKYVNAFFFDAEEARLIGKRDAGELTDDELEAEVKALRERYTAAGADMPDYGNFGEDAASYRAGLLKALDDPLMVEAFPKVLPAVKEYEDYLAYAKERTGKDSFGSNEMSEWRSWLKGKAISLLERYPAFRTTWSRVYASDVEVAK